MTDRSALKLRLAGLMQRISAYGADERLNAEIEDAARLLENPGHEFSGHFALLALERYVDLQDTLQNLSSVVSRDAAMQAGRSLGGKTKPRKLPPRHELQQEAMRLVTVRQMPTRSVRGVLAKKYSVTPQAVGKALRNLKPT